MALESMDALWNAGGLTTKGRGLQACNLRRFSLQQRLSSTELSDLMAEGVLDTRKRNPKPKGSKRATRTGWEGCHRLSAYSQLVGTMSISRTIIVRRPPVHCNQDHPL